MKGLPLPLPRSYPAPNGPDLAGKGGNWILPEGYWFMKDLVCLGRTVDRQGSDIVTGSKTLKGCRLGL